MKYLEYLTIVLASMFSFDATALASELRHESQREKQALGIYSLPSGTPILTRVFIPNSEHQYTQFTSIEVQGDEHLVEARGINNRGQIVGFYYDENWSEHGFLLDRGMLTAIDIPGAWATEIYRINDLRQMVGNYYDGAGIHAFLLEGDTVTPIQFPGAQVTRAAGINNRGQIVGSYTTSGVLRHGFLLDNGVYTTIDVPGAVETYAQDINNRGQIVGNSRNSEGRSLGFLLEEGVLTTIDVPESSFGPEINGINSRGQIVGGFRADLSLGLVYDRGVLSLIAFPSADGTLLTDINDQGQIVGDHWEYGGQLPIFHGFVAE